MAKKNLDKKYYFFVEKSSSKDGNKTRNTTFFATDDAFPLDFTLNLILGLTW